MLKNITLIAVSSSMLLAGCKTDDLYSTGGAVIAGTGAHFLGKAAGLSDEQSAMLGVVAATSTFAIVQSTQKQREIAKEKAEEEFAKLPAETQEKVQREQMPILVNVPRESGQDTNSRQYVRVDPKSLEPVDNELIEIPEETSKDYAVGEIVGFDEESVLVL